MIYLVVFAVTTALIWMSGRSRDAIFGILATRGLAIPRLIVGARDKIGDAKVLSYAKLVCIDAQVIDSGFMCFFGRRSDWVLAEAIAACVGVAFALESRIVVLASVLEDAYRYRVSYLGENDCRVYGAYLLASVLLIWVLMRYEFTDGKVEVRGVALGERFSVSCLISVVGSLAWLLHLISGMVDGVGYYGAALITHPRGTHGQCISPAGSILAASTFPSLLLWGSDVHVRQIELPAVYVPDAWNCLTWQRELSTCPWVGFIDINHSSAPTGGSLWRS